MMTRVPKHYRPFNRNPLIQIIFCSNIRQEIYLYFSDIFLISII